MKLDTTDGHKDMAYEQHIGTYSSFIRLTIAFVAFLVVLLAGMAFFLL